MPRDFRRYKVYEKDFCVLPCAFHGPIHGRLPRSGRGERIIRPGKQLHRFLRSSPTVSSEAAQSQDSPNNQENQALGAAFRIDTEKQLVWDEGFDAERSLLTRYEYDQSGRLLRTVPEGGDSYSINCYEYDEDGNLVREYDSD